MNAWMIDVNVKANTNTEAIDLDEKIIRQILCSIEENEQFSQRQLSQKLGIALGSVNWYLKRCMSKGFIKMQQAPLRRYMYYLTPQGFDEKSRLVGQYLKWSLDLFRMGRDQSGKILKECAQSGRSDIYLAGDSDLAEIFILSSMEEAVHVRGLYDRVSDNDKRLSVPVFTDVDLFLKDARDSALAVFILTELNAPQVVWDQLVVAGVPEDQIIVPDLLGFFPKKYKEVGAI